MSELPTEWGALLALVFVLGLRHGIDADHIATIDALTRLSSGSGRRSARYSGLLFAGGHGGAVLVGAAALALAGGNLQPPPELASVGAWISIAMLAVLGLTNLRAGLVAAPGQPVVMAGLRGRLLSRLLGDGRPAAALAIGALFALSLDTSGLAVMFAVAGRAAGGVPGAMILAGVFAAGMAVTDGANGWWLARLLARGGAGAARATRWAALAVGALSLIVASLGALRWAWPTANKTGDAWAAALGPAMVLVVLAGYLALRWRRRLTGPSPVIASNRHSVS
jgi:high-affinity nickel-transport protein